MNEEGTDDNIFYLLRSASNDGEDLFKVDPDGGEVRVKSTAIDRELFAEYTLFVEAQDLTTTPTL